ncbi:MAG: gamma subclass chorismate mutase AroQ [Betaproteobacteria bacterium]|nr:gamma subclass chorismate mutase AroQ [Betaproteobacteria bacterium]
MRGEARAAPLVFSTLLTLLLSGCAAQPPAADVEKIDHVLQLIQQRLGHMDDVARNKWNSGAAIEDLPREREIIDGLGRQAADYGLDAAVARDFFRAQIEASKVIQRTRFKEWQAANQPKFVGVRDLARDIRPALDALTPAMMQGLAAALPELKKPGSAPLVDARARAIIKVNAADIPALDTAAEPLKSLALPR